MDTLFNWLSFIVSLTTTISTVILSWILFKKEHNKTYLKERYEKLIFPIFNILEDHLYKKEITPEIKKAVEECKNIINKNKLIAGGKLTFVFFLPLNSASFWDISKLIDKEYDECCSALGIPLRPLDKKIYTFHTRNIRILVLWVIKYFIPLFLFILSLTSVVLIFQYLTSTQNTVIC